MADDGPWLNVPQTAVLEVTRDIELAVGLTAETTPLLVIKANQRLCASHRNSARGKCRRGSAARRRRASKNGPAVR